MPTDFLTVFSCLTILASGYPIVQALRAEWQTSLRHTLAWACLAWLASFVAAILPVLGSPAPPLVYVALCFRAAVVVALLGARRPGMAAWNFVVCGLLAVLSLPLVQQPWSSPDWQLEGVWAGLLGIILMIGVSNYLPVPGMQLAAVAVGLLSGLELAYLFNGGRDQPMDPWLAAVQGIAALGVWATYRMMRRPFATTNPVESVWHHFRNRYGLVWGLRVKDHFNNAVRNAGWTSQLTWLGLKTPPTGGDAEQKALVQILSAALKRFGLR